MTVANRDGPYRTDGVPRVRTELVDDCEVPVGDNTVLLLMRRARLTGSIVPGERRKKRHRGSGRGSCYTSV